MRILRACCVFMLSALLASVSVRPAVAAPPDDRGFAATAISLIQLLVAPPQPPGAQRPHTRRAPQAVRAHPIAARAAARIRLARSGPQAAPPR